MSALLKVGDQYPESHAHTKAKVFAFLNFNSENSNFTMTASAESYRLAFPSKSKPYISTGLPFPKACAHHVTNTFHASKAYVIVSNSISKTDNFVSLRKALGDKVVGVRNGIKPHTPWDDVLEIVKDIRENGADIIITLGAGSLTDGAKVIAFVCFCLCYFLSHQTYHQLLFQSKH